MSRLNIRLLTVLPRLVAGTIIPSIALDVAAAAVVNAGSYFECIYLGPAAVVGGSWS